MAKNLLLIIFRVSNSPPFLLPRGKVRNPFYCSSGFGDQIFSSGFLGVLRKQNFHDFVNMKGKKGAKFLGEDQIE